MKKVRFLLEHPTAEESRILLIYRFGKNAAGKEVRLKHPTGEACKSELWLKESRRVKTFSHDDINRGTNKRLGQIEQTANRYLDQCKTENRNPEKEEMKKFILSKGKISVNNELVPYFERYVENRKLAGVRASNTVRSDRLALDKVKALEAEIGIIRFDDVDLSSFYYPLLAQNKHLMKNSFSRIIVTIKAVMRRAIKDGLTDNRKWDCKEFSRSTEKKDSTYANIDDLKKIMECELNGELSVSRDAFVLGCNIGLRYGDLKRLGEQHITNDKIKIIAEKTKKLVLIPLNSTCREILKKHDGKPYVPYLNKFNTHIKEVCRLAGINSKIMLNGEQFVKSQKITSHTMRRSFATNFYKSNVPIGVLMKITGHSTESEFLGYIGITLEENAEEALSYKVFQ